MRRSAECPRRFPSISTSPDAHLTHSRFWTECCECWDALKPVPNTPPPSTRLSHTHVRSKWNGSSGGASVRRRVSGTSVWTWARGKLRARNRRMDRGRRILDPYKNRTSARNDPCAECWASSRRRSSALRSASLLRHAVLRFCPKNTAMVGEQRLFACLLTQLDEHGLDRPSSVSIRRDLSLPRGSVIALTPA